VEEMTPLNVADYGMAGIAVAAIAYVSVNIVKLFTISGKVTPQEERQDGQQAARDSHNDKLIELFVRSVDGQTSSNQELKQVLKELQPIMQQTCTTIQILSNAQRWDMVEEVLKHTVEEKGNWKDCLKALDDLFKEIRARK
jgi:hypothetical protein